MNPAIEQARAIARAEASRIAAQAKAQQQAASDAAREAAQRAANEAARQQVIEASRQAAIDHAKNQAAEQARLQAAEEAKRIATEQAQQEAARVAQQEADKNMDFNASDRFRDFNDNYGSDYGSSYNYTDTYSAPSYDTYTPSFDTFDYLDTINTYDAFDTASNYANSVALDNYNYSDNVSDFLDTYDSDYFDPNTYIDLSTDAIDTDFSQSIIDNSYGGDFDAGLDIGQTFDYLDGVDINSDDFSNYDASTQFAAQDVSTFDEKELDILKSVGAIEINEDGAVTDFDSQNALRQIEDQLIEYRGDLSDEEITNLTSLRNEILAAEDLGLDAFSIDIADQPSSALAGEGGSVGLVGTDFSNKFLFSGDPDYEESKLNSLSAGYINEGNAAKNSQIYGNTGGKFNIYGEPVDMRTNPALQGMSFQATPNAAGSVIQGVDTFTDYLRNGAGMLLKPVNWLSDGIGGGLDAIGGALGNNPIGRGFSSFGNIVDNTGDYLFGSGDRDSLLGTVFNVPDNLTKTVAGGLSGNWDVAKQGLKGLVAAPFELAGNAISVPVAIAKDVFGVDDISLSVGGGSGGGGGGGGRRMPSRQAPQRKKISRVLGSGNSREGISSVSGSTVGYAGNEYDMSTASGQKSLLNDSDFPTLADAIAQTGGSSLLSDDQIRGLVGMGNSPGAGPSSGTADDPIGSTDVDGSSLAEKFEEKQGGEKPKVKKTAQVESIENIIDKLANGSVRKTKAAPALPTTSTGSENLDIFDNDAPLIGEKD